MISDIPTSLFWKDWYVPNCTVELTVLFALLFNAYFHEYRRATLLLDEYRECKYYIRDT